MTTIYHILHPPRPLHNKLITYRPILYLPTLWDGQERRGLRALRILSRMGYRLVPSCASLLFPISLNCKQKLHGQAWHRSIPKTRGMRPYNLSVLESRLLRVQRLALLRFPAPSLVLATSTALLPPLVAWPHPMAMVRFRNLLHSSHSPPKVRPHIPLLPTILDLMWGHHGSPVSQKLFVWMK